MRQREQFEGMSCDSHWQNPANHIDKLFERKKLGDGKFTHGNDEVGFEELDFSKQPAGAVLNLLAIRNAISALGVLARKASANGCEIYPLSCLGFVPSGGPMDPSK